MYKRTKNIRRRIKVLRFFEVVVLPLATSINIMFLMFIIAISVFGVRFSSRLHMLVIVGLIVALIGGLVFEISRELIKKILKK